MKQTRGYSWPMPLDLRHHPALPVPALRLIAEARVEASHVMRGAADRSREQGRDPLLEHLVGRQADRILEAVRLQVLVYVGQGEGRIAPQQASECLVAIARDDRAEHLAPAVRAVHAGRRSSPCPVLAPGMGAALAAWAAYHDRIERECADGGRFAGAREWASKQAGRVAKLAGILHLVETVGSGRPLTWRIPVETVDAAVEIGGDLEAHALTDFDLMQVPTELEGARRILAWLHRRVNSADSAEPLLRFSARDAFSALDRKRFTAMNHPRTPR